MVKVIGRDESKVKHISCGKCAAKLEYTPSEVKERHGTDYSGGPDGEEWVDCPNCGGRAIIRSW